MLYKFNFAKIFEFKVHSMYLKTEQDDFFLFYDASLVQLWTNILLKKYSFKTRVRYQYYSMYSQLLVQSLTTDKEIVHIH